MALSDGVNGIHLSRTSLDVVFDDNGPQINADSASDGNVAGMIVLLDECGWQVRSAQKVSLPHQYFLMARQGASEKND